MTVAAEGKALLRIQVSALGGEGGGVLMNWIVAAARLAGHQVQATSVPGVAQRTGSTSYYIEIARLPGQAEMPVFSLMPMPARVDVVLASELIEAARAIETGFVSPTRTTLIASISRVYATAEKIDMGDGRFDPDAAKDAAQAMAKACFLLDLEGLAQDNGTFISATMFGALCGSGVLPWDADLSRQVLGIGAGAAASQRGFDAACQAVATPPGDTPTPEASVVIERQHPLLAGFGDLPLGLRDVIGHGYDRCCDFQDKTYGALYVTRLQALLEGISPGDPVTDHALEEAARRLALWMAYEDIARVADLKTRRTRFAGIRAEVELQPGQILRVTEYLKPRAEEVAAILPLRLGVRLMRRVEKGRGLPFLGRGIYLQSSSVLGFYLLRGLAGMARFRRSSLRYRDEQTAIEGWLTSLKSVLAVEPGYAAALAELPRVLKGYSDTQMRGLKAYRDITQQVVAPDLVAGVDARSAQKLRRAIAAALSDDSHKALAAALADDANDALDVPILKTKADSDAD